jgi:protein-tyrosine-phosphatase
MTFYRRFVLIIVALTLMSPGAGRASTNVPTVLFVCDAGTAKSAIARELFRKRARERGIAVTAFSRGLQIEDHISLPLKARLETEGIDSRLDGFAVLSADDVRAADLVVTFTKLPKVYRPRKMLDWTALPSVNDAWPAARAELTERIEGLLDAIEAKGGSRK